MKFIPPLLPQKNPFVSSLKVLCLPSAPIRGSLEEQVSPLYKEYDTTVATLLHLELHLRVISLCPSETPAGFLKLRFQCVFILDFGWPKTQTWTCVGVWVWVLGSGLWALGSGLPFLVIASPGHRRCLIFVAARGVYGRIYKMLQKLSKRPTTRHPLASNGCVADGYYAHVAAGCWLLVADGKMLLLVGRVADVNGA